MARNWIVLTADRDPHDANAIIAYTEWDGYTAAADEVVYSDPVDVDGNAVDSLWKVGGSVILAAGVYTYTDPGTDPSLADRQRGQIHAAYLYWRIFGRTSHWAGIRAHTTNTPTDPLDATDKWALHIVALVDQAINGVFPITGAMTPDQLQAFVDHADNILRRLGPTWYDVQIEKVGYDPKPSSWSHGGGGKLQANGGPEWINHLHGHRDCSRRQPGH